MAFQTESVNVFDVVPELTSKPAKGVGRQQPVEDTCGLQVSSPGLPAVFTLGRAGCGVHRCRPASLKLRFISLSSVFPEEIFGGCFPSLSKASVK